MLEQSGEGGNQEWKNQCFRLWESETPEAQVGRKTKALYMCVVALKVCVCWCNRGQGLIWRHRETVIPPPPKAHSTGALMFKWQESWHKCVQCCTVASELCV